jgi:excisionase family DNA binding protein
MAMNAPSQFTAKLTLTGQITIDATNLEQLFSGLKIQMPRSSLTQAESSITPKPPIDQAKLHRLAYTVNETAEMLGLSTKTVYRLIERGLLKSVGALRHKRITRAEIDRFLKTTAVY